MNRLHPGTAFYVAAAVMLLACACIRLPLTLPPIPTSEEPTQPSQPSLPAFAVPPRDALLSWSSALSEEFCRFNNSGRFISMVQNSGELYAVRSQDATSVWRYQIDGDDSEKISESMTDDGKFVEDLRVNDKWLVMLIFDHPMHLEGWRIEALNLNTLVQQRVIDNIEAPEERIYLDMELQGDQLLLLTQTVKEDGGGKLSAISVFNLAVGTTEQLLSTDSELVYQQMAVAGDYLMISQSADGKDPEEILPILFLNLKTRQFEDSVEVTGSHPLMNGSLAAWSEQGTNHFPETYKILDFETGLSWPLLIGSAQPAHFNLSAEYLAWFDPSEQTSALPALFLVSLDDGHSLTLLSESPNDLLQFPQVWDGKLIFGLVKDPLSVEASSQICAVPLADLEELAGPVH